MSAHVRACAAVLFATAALRAQGELSVRHAAPANLAFGTAFALDVAFTFPAGGEPLPFDEGTAAPLWLALDRLERSRDGAREVATWHFTARLLASGDVAVPPLVARARYPDGRIVAAQATIGPFAVASRLPEPPGELEWPGDVRDLPRRRWWPWLLAVGGVAAGAVLWLARRARVAQPPAAAAEVPPVVVPGAAARAALAALREPDPSDAAAVLAHAIAVAAIVRGHCGDLGVGAWRSRTSQELVARVPAGRESLQACLQACDLVKFAAHRPTAEGLRALRASADAFVAASSGATA